MTVQELVEQIIEEHPDPEEAAVKVAERVTDILEGLGGATGPNVSLTLEVELESLLEEARHDNRPDLDDIGPLLALDGVDIPKARALHEAGLWTIEDLHEIHQAELQQIDGIDNVQAARIKAQLDEWAGVLERNEEAEEIDEGELPPIREDEEVLAEASLDLAGDKIWVDILTLNQGQYAADIHLQNGQNGRVKAYDFDSLMSKIYWGLNQHGYPQDEIDAEFDKKMPGHLGLDGYS